MKPSLKALLETSHLYGGNATFIEELYDQYLENPNSVAEPWRDFFDRMQQEGLRDRSHSSVIESFRRKDGGGRIVVQAAGGMDARAAEKQAAVLRLINAWRVRGHQLSAIDPLQLNKELHEPPPRDLDPLFHHLTEQDMDTEFNTGSLVAPERMTLREIFDFCIQVYGGTIGAEYMHITRTPEKRWIQARLEGSRAKLELSDERRVALLERTTAAEGLERYLHSKYVGQKRFSLEGGESLIPMLDEMLQRAGSHGIKETAIGMAHRGRLNVLINILGKSPRELFEEFEGKKKKTGKGSGDVKYHMGFSSDMETPGGTLHLALGFNPSHLEIINPVIEGSVRARQQRRDDHTGKQVLPILIHGDAAFAGQGVVMETLQMSNTRGYTTGGTVHIVINNQVGFTTSNPVDSRSTFHCTEVAKMVQAPIFHVNGDDPEAVLFVTQLALDYRMEFGKDVVIDLVCYRRHGHNEADEPAATQPTMYQIIRARPTTRQLYAEKLTEAGVLAPGEGDKMVTAYRDALDEGRLVAKGIVESKPSKFSVDWTPYLDKEWTDEGDTSIKPARLRQLADTLLDLPEGVELHARVARIYADRRKMAAGAAPADWGFAETMAYASLLTEGYPVRLSGQDCGRGTFFHRHAVLHNQTDGSNYIPLQNLAEDQARFIVIDSLLSEEAVMGFEYGFSTADPTSLVIWEGQFGDFANGAQVVIDQFISSGESKWNRLCGLALFLPHGFEGQGPEHSSARLERYLQLCAEYNMQVCVPTTPAQIFHLIRRQMVRNFRKPLVVMTPKSLLRHKQAVSSLEELTSGQYRTIIDEIDEIDGKKVKRVVLCSGKVYYDLLEARRAQELDDVAIVRMEQLYPFPREALVELMKRYPNAKQVVWCQEEPRNQGAWYQQRHHYKICIGPKRKLYYAGRNASASPAAGSFAEHAAQQQALVEKALTGKFETAE
ncbi:MAG: 2-oxoglutarate dehydrogenase E1 component [Gammaproteobacteria bacterium]|jgi:2-oxoglutarate dehydrogenase E1 component|nr:2-oxoglutarate dehydrogenase E1 component [Gammaproteobacteria bacterium]